MSKMGDFFGYGIMTGIMAFGFHEWNQYSVSEHAKRIERDYHYDIQIYGEEKAFKKMLEAQKEWEDKHDSWFDKL